MKRLPLAVGAFVLLFIGYVPAYFVSGLSVSNVSVMDSRGGLAAGTVLLEIRLPMTKVTSWIEWEWCPSVSVLSWCVSSNGQIGEASLIASYGGLSAIRVTGELSPRVDWSRSMGLKVFGDVKVSETTVNTEQPTHSSINASAQFSEVLFMGNYSDTMSLKVVEQEQGHHVSIDSMSLSGEIDAFRSGQLKHTYKYKYDDPQIVGLLQMLGLRKPGDTVSFSNALSDLGVSR